MELAFITLLEIKKIQAKINAEQIFFMAFLLAGKSITINSFKFFIDIIFNCPYKKY